MGAKHSINLNADETEAYKASDPKILKWIKDVREGQKKDNVPTQIYFSDGSEGPLLED